MTVVGECFVAIQPESTGFAKSLATQVQTAVGGIPAIGGIALAAGGAALALGAIGESFEGAYRTIRSGTGATKEQMEGLEGSFKKVLASGPATMDQVAAAVTGVSQRLKFTGADLEAFSETELKLSRITKTEVAPLIDATTKALANYGIQGAAPSKAALEQLLAVSQDTGIAIPQLAAAVSGKAGASFRALGVDIGSAASIMGHLEAAGISTGPVVMSLSKAITEAQKSGKSASEALGGIFETLKNGTPGTAAYEDAIKSLGSRGFQTLRDAIQSGKLSMEDFTGQLAQAPGLIDRVASENASLGGKLKTLKNMILVALEPIATKIIEGATAVVSMLIPALEWLLGVFDSLGAVVSEFWSALMSGFTENEGTPIERFALRIRAIFVEAFEVASQAWSSFVEAFKAGGDDITSSGVNGVFERIGLIARSAFDAMAEAWGEFTAGFSGEDASGPFAKIGEIIRVVVDFIRDNAMPILASFGAVFGAFIASGAIALVVALLADLVGVLIGIAGALLSPIVLIGALVAGIVLLYQNSETFRTILSTVADVLVLVAEKVAEFAQTALPYIIDGLNAVGGAMSDFAAGFMDRWDHISGSIRNVALVIAGIIGGMVAAVLFIWDHFGDQIMAVIRFSTDVVVSIFEYMKRVMLDIFDFITSLLSGDWGAAWDAFKDIPAAAIDFVIGMASNLQGFLEGFLSSLPANILGAAGDLGGYLVDLINIGVDAMTGALDTGLEAIIGFFTDLPGIILESSLGLFSFALSDLGGSLISGIVSGLEAALGFVTDWLSGLPGKAWTFVQGAANFIADAAVIAAGFITNFIAGLGSVASTVFEWVAGLPGQVWTALGTLGQWERDALAIGVDLIGKLVSGLGSAVGTVIGWIANLPGNVWAGLQTLGQWERDAIKIAVGFMANIITGLGQKILDVASWFVELPGKVLDFAGGMFTNFIGFGRKIIDKIIEGIKEAPGRIFNAVKEAAKSGAGALINSTPLGFAYNSLFGAEGGIFDQATPKIIGEAGREVLIPLTDQARAQELATKSGLLNLLAVGGNSNVSGTASSTPSAVDSTRIGVNIERYYEEGHGMADLEFYADTKAAGV